MQRIVLPVGRKDAARAAAFLNALPTDKAWTVIVAAFKRTRSDQQNNYLWGVCYPAVLRGGGELLGGWTDKDLHEHFLCEHFGAETLEGFGKTQVKPRRRSSKLSPMEFADYVASIQRACAPLGIYVPDPGEQV